MIKERKRKTEEPKFLGEKEFNLGKQLPLDRTLLSDEVGAKEP